MEHIISTNLREDGVLEIYHGDELMYTVGDGRTDEDFVEDILYGLGYQWNEDGTITKLYDNEKLNASLVDIWGFQHRIPIMDKYITDERWNTNKDLEDLFINLLHNVHFPDKENARNPIIDIILEKPDLYKEEQQQANIITILNQTINPVQAPIAEKLLSAPEFLKNKLGSDTKVFTIGDKQVIDAELVILDKILSEPKLRNNESIQKNLPNVLYDNEHDVEKSLNAKLSH